MFRLAAAAAGQAISAGLQPTQAALALALRRTRPDPTGGQQARPAGSRVGTPPKSSSRPMPPAVLPGNFHQTLNLGLSQVLASPQIGIGRPLRHDCSVYDAWRDEFQMRFGHVFSPPSLTDCSDNARS